MYIAKFQKYPQTRVQVDFTRTRFSFLSLLNTPHLISISTTLIITHTNLALLSNSPQLAPHSLSHRLTTMADRVHPHTSPPASAESQPAPPPSEKPPSPTGTYVIQIPKDQVYRVPPPENARRYANYNRRKTRRCGFCCCLCWLIGLLFILIVLLGIAAGVSAAARCRRFTSRRTM